MPSDPHVPQWSMNPLMFVVLAVSVGVVVLLLSGVVPQLEPVAPEPSVTAAAPAADVAPDTPVAADSQVAEAAEVLAVVPKIDLVRVEADGTAVVAGQAEPRARISVVLDGETLAQADADDGGDFAVFLTIAPDDAPRILWLMAETDAGETVESSETVVIAPRPAIVPEIAADAEADAAGEELAQADATDPVVDETTETEADDLTASSGSEPAVAPEDAAAEPEPALADAATEPSGMPEPDSEAAVEMAEMVEESAAPDATPDAAVEAEAMAVSPEDVAVAEPAAPRLLMNDSSGVRVLDASPLNDPAALRVDTIDYGADGAVVVRGQAGAPGAVRATLDGEPKAEGTADVVGGWTLSLPDVVPGTYALEIERVDDDGQVLARAELPFTREPAAEVEAALTAEPVRVVTVERGATLWAIARDRYGDGTRYVQVFEANRDKISDPDLIYPGQILTLPDDPAAAQ
ncbi:MAG: LysM peptidoglycan-binding domain-containing protein [Rhodobacteraceae bacterium]|nr:LysM peptidoglycan-binding domain-containing protein [Paracoccaceae bacterium]